MSDDEPSTLAESIRRRIAKLKDDPSTTWPHTFDLGKDNETTSVSLSESIRQKIDEAKSAATADAEITGVDAQADKPNAAAAKKAGMTSSKTNIRQFVRELTPGTKLGAYEIIALTGEDDKTKTYSAKQINFDINVNIVVPKVTSKESIQEYQNWIRQLSRLEIEDPRGMIVDQILNGMVVYAVLRNQR